MGEMYVVKVIRAGVPVWESEPIGDRFTAAGEASRISRRIEVMGTGGYAVVRPVTATAPIPGA